MIHPDAESLNLDPKIKGTTTKSISKNWKILTFYFLAFVVNLVNFVPGMHPAINYNLHGDATSDVMQWFKVSFVLSIPLTFEFSLAQWPNFLQPAFCPPRKNKSHHRQLRLPPILF